MQNADDELLQAAKRGDTEAVGRILESGVSARRAADAMRRAVFSGRLEVLDQIQAWSRRRWGVSLLEDDAVLDWVLTAQHTEGGEDDALDDRLSRLRNLLESRGASTGSVVSFALAGGLAEATEVEQAVGSTPDMLDVPSSGLSLLPARSDQPLGDPEDGVEYFAARMFGTFPQWSILALEASADALAPRLGELLATERWVPDAASHLLESAEDEFFLLQLQNHDWSLLLSVSLPQTPRLLGDYAADASARLGVRTVAFAYEETGGSSIAQIFENGRARKRARNRKGWTAFFRELGLFVPFFGLHTEDRKTELMLEGLQSSDVAALHYFT